MRRGPAAASGDSELSRATLKGLTGVEMLIGGFGDDSRRAGFDETAFQTAAELKLRLAGINVFTDEQKHATPVLYVNVNTLATEAKRSASFSIRLELWQLVRLWRNRERAYAATWSTDAVGNGEAAFVLENFKEQMDEFLNAWLSVNPKEGVK